MCKRLEAHSLAWINSEINPMECISYQYWFFFPSPSHTYKCVTSQIYMRQTTHCSTTFNGDTLVGQVDRHCIPWARVFDAVITHHCIKGDISLCQRLILCLRHSHKDHGTPYMCGSSTTHGTPYMSKVLD